MFCDIVPGAVITIWQLRHLIQIAGFKEIIIQGSLWNAQRYLQSVYCLWLSMFVMIGNDRSVLSLIERYKGERVHNRIP